MSKPVLIFGNGIGMAIDPVHFSLANALEAVWNPPWPPCVVSDDQKLRISACLGHADITHPPTGEHELFDLQRAIDAVEFLKELGVVGADDPWLQEEARDFPVATGRYFATVAERFCDSNFSLPEEFVNDLTAFIKSARPHVATLNYDWLIYRKLVELKLCAGYDGDLVDGFHRDGFAAENMLPRFRKTFGWYLHLHGSPRIATDPTDDSIRKLDQDQVAFADEWKRHLILTHYKLKARLIGQSPILSVYWDLLSVALDRTPMLVLMGYSGLDNHLNARIKETTGGNSDRRIIVVEWSGSGDAAGRKKFWSDHLGVEPEIKLLNNILEFRFEELSV